MKTITSYLKNKTTIMDGNWLWLIFSVPVCQNEGQSQSLMQPVVQMLVLWSVEELPVMWTLAELGMQNA